MCHMFMTDFAYDRPRILKRLKNLLKFLSLSPRLSIMPSTIFSLIPGIVIDIEPNLIYSF